MSSIVNQLTRISVSQKPDIKAFSDRFNIKDFHSAVLDHGNPPLFIVEQKIDEMIEKNLNTN